MKSTKQRARHGNAGEKLRIRKAESLARKKERLAILQARFKKASGQEKARIGRSISVLRGQINKGVKTPYTGPKVKHGDSRGHHRKKRYWNQTTKKWQKTNPKEEEKKQRLEESRNKTNEESLKKRQEIEERRKQNKETGTKEFATWNTTKGNEAYGAKLEDSKIVKKNTGNNKNVSVEKNKENKQNNKEEVKPKTENKNTGGGETKTIDKPKPKEKLYAKYRRTEGEGIGKGDTRITKRLKKAGFTETRLAKLRKEHAEWKAKRKKKKKK